DRGPALGDPPQRRRRRGRRRPRRRPARGPRARAGRARLGRRGGAARPTCRFQPCPGSDPGHGRRGHVRFADALAAPRFGAVAEFKRRSPSAGDLRPGGDVVAVARAYEANGARAMSVLVDERFGGWWEDVRAARRATGLPLLAKGFFSTAEHLRTARDAGADAALLILRDLDDAQCAELMRDAEALGIDTLVEAHDAEELARATALGAP